MSTGDASAGLDQEVFQIEIPFAISICVFYILTSIGVEWYKTTHNKSLWIHQSSISCIFGVIVGFTIDFIFQVLITFNSNFFFYMVLPPIIFSAGYNLRRKRFFQYMDLILFFGIVGTICNFLIIAYGAYTFCQLFPSSLSITWNQSLLLSAVLAGSDEVAAISLIEVDAYPRLGALIFGEGVINDALSIVLFRTFLPVFEDERKRYPTGIGATVTPSVITTSIMLQILFSVFIGIFFGLTNAFVLKYLSFTKQFPIYQTALILLFGYLSYSIAEVSQVSGILTLFVTAITMAHYSWYSLSKAAQVATKLSFSAISDIAEGFAFAYVGLSLWAFANREFHYLFAFYMVIVLILARLVTICGLFYVTKFCFKSFNIPVKEQLGFVLGGVVRGCLSWAQVLQIRGSSMLVTTTLIIVMTSTIGCGFVLPIVLPYLIPEKADNHNEVNTTFSEAEGESSSTTMQQAGRRGGVFSPVDISPVNKYESLPSGPSLELTGLSSNKANQTTRNIDGEAKEEHEEVVQPMSSLSSFLFFQWIRFDEKVMKPMFGGSKTEGRRLQLINRTSDLLYQSFMNANQVTHSYFREEKRAERARQELYQMYNEEEEKLLSEPIRDRKSYGANYVVTDEEESKALQAVGVIIEQDGE